MNNIIKDCSIINRVTGHHGTWMDIYVGDGHKAFLSDDM